jgi:hypothetical protein
MEESVLGGVCQYPILMDCTLSGSHVVRRGRLLLEEGRKTFITMFKFLNEHIFTV